MIDKQQFFRAKTELVYAKNKLDLMQKASDINALGILWQEFLISINRTFNKLKNATKNHSSKGWYDNIEIMRKNDELLSYIRHARNVDEHGLEEILDNQQAHHEISLKNGHSAYIDFMHIKGDQITLGQEAAKNLSVRFSPAKVLPKPVKDRGVIYYPPTKHLNVTIDGSNPVIIAELTVKYLDNIINDAEQFNK